MGDSVSVACSHCQANLRVATAAAGKKVRCPKCKAAVAIPLPKREAERSEAELEAIAAAAWDEGTPAGTPGDWRAPPSEPSVGTLVVSRKEVSEVNKRIEEEPEVPVNSRRRWIPFSALVATALLACVGAWFAFGRSREADTGLAARPIPTPTTTSIQAVPRPGGREHSPTVDTGARDVAKANREAEAALLDIRTRLAKLREADEKNRQIVADAACKSLELLYRHRVNVANTADPAVREYINRSQSLIANWQRPARQQLAEIRLATRGMFMDPTFPASIRSRFQADAEQSVVAMQAQIERPYNEGEAQFKVWMAARERASVAAYEAIQRHIKQETAVGRKAGAQRVVDMLLEYNRRAMAGQLEYHSLLDLREKFILDGSDGTNKRGPVSLPVGGDYIPPNSTFTLLESEQAAIKTIQAGNLTGVVRETKQERLAKSKLAYEALERYAKSCPDKSEVVPTKITMINTQAFYVDLYVLYRTNKLTRLSALKAYDAHLIPFRSNIQAVRDFATFGGDWLGGDDPSLPTVREVFEAFDKAVDLNAIEKSLRQ